MRSAEPLVVLAPRDPSAASIAVRGDRGTVLVDAGYGAALDELEARLAAAGVDPAAVGLLALTHMHCDHAGGAAGLQARHGIPVALHESEARLVADRSPDAGDARWLAHPFAPFAVQHPLHDGDVLDAHGGPALVCLHLGAQTPGHTAFHLPDLGVLLTGDLLQEHDVAWLPPGRERVVAALAALDRLEAAGARRAVPGHGPPVEDVPAAIDRARTRYAGWLEYPARGAWHALKRLAVSALQLVDPTPGGAEPLLAATPWLRSYAEALGAEPPALAREVLDELRRVGAIRDTAGGVRPAAPHSPRRPHPFGPLRPADWPADLEARPGAGAWP